MSKDILITIHLDNDVSDISLKEIITNCNSQNISPEKIIYDKLFEKVTNKGKWGDKDKRGTVNYIDNNKILNALKLPKKGISVSLSFDITQDSSQINHSNFDEVTKYDHQASSLEKREL